jgi:hypothetical protein
MFGAAAELAAKEEDGGWVFHYGAIVGKEKITRVVLQEKQMKYKKQKEKRKGKLYENRAPSMWSHCGHCVWRRVVEDEWWALSSCPASTVQSTAAAASADATRKACGDGGGSYCSLHRLLVGRLLRGELYTSPVR